MIRSFPPHPNPPPRGEGRPFIPPAGLGGILEYFDNNDAEKVSFSVILTPYLIRGKNLTRSVILNEVKDLTSSFAMLMRFFVARSSSE
jgi:hypothetical protein